MAFTELMRRGPYLALCVLMALAGCATAPESPTEPGSVVRTEVEGPSALPEGPVTPNPYEQMSVRVSASARADFDRALAMMEADDWRAAYTLLNGMTERYPELSGPWVNLALVHRQRGDTDAAEEALTRALAVNPNNLDAYNALALIKREAGDFEAAERHYRQALSVWPFHAQSHLNLGVLLDLYRGEGEQALQHYRAYQQRQAQRDRTVAGWIVDLERRLAAEEAQ